MFPKIKSAQQAITFASLDQMPLALAILTHNDQVKLYAWEC